MNLSTRLLSLSGTLQRCGTDLISPERMVGNLDKTLSHIHIKLHNASLAEAEPNSCIVLATQYLKDKPPGSFVIRNSTTYPGSYGLTLRVAQVPSNVPLSGG